MTYLIANEASDRRSTTYRSGSDEEPWWSYRIEYARRWSTRAAAHAALSKIESERSRAGRRFVVEGPAA